MEENSKPRKVADIVFVAFFLVGIWLPLGMALLDLDRSVTLAENRPVATMPPLRLTPTALKTYSARFEAYYNDNFGLRSNLIRWHNLVKLRWLGVSPNRGVLIGKDGWLYLGRKELLADFRAVDPFSREDLILWQRSLETRRDWLAERGIRYLFVISPNKQSIYPEFLPSGITRVGSDTRLDQLVAWLRIHSDMEILDLREALLRAKDRERVYYRTDTHWNELGAYVAYERIMERLGEWFPERETKLRAPPLSTYAILRKTTPGGDLARLLGVPDLFTETTILLDPASPRLARPLLLPAKGASRIRRRVRVLAMGRLDVDAPLSGAVMFHDSFGRALIPFLSEHFRQIVYVWDREFDPDFIVRFSPRLIIQEVSERALLEDSPGPDRLFVRRAGQEE